MLNLLALQDRWVAQDERLSQVPCGVSTQGWALCHPSPAHLDQTLLLWPHVPRLGPVLPLPSAITTLSPILNQPCSVWQDLATHHPSLMGPHLSLGTMLSGPPGSPEIQKSGSREGAINTDSAPPPPNFQIFSPMGSSMGWMILLCKLDLACKPRDEHFCPSIVASVSQLGPTCACLNWAYHPLKSWLKYPRVLTLKSLCI